jgi:hypothetical protein
MKSSIKLQGGYTMDDNPVIWFFEVLQESSEDFKANFLFFMTGMQIITK